MIKFMLDYMDNSKKVFSAYLEKTIYDYIVSSIFLDDDNVIEYIEKRISSSEYSVDFDNIVMLETSFDFDMTINDNYFYVSVEFTKLKSNKIKVTNVKVQ